MSAPPDDHILRLACVEFQNRHKVMLRLMELKHTTDAEMIRLVSAMGHGDVSKLSLVFRNDRRLSSTSRLTGSAMG